MTVYKRVIRDLGLKESNEFQSRITEIIDSTQTVILRFLRRREWIEELDNVLAEATIMYFKRRYPEYLNGVSEACFDTQEISSVSDNGQSVSYRSGTDCISAEAKAAGLDDILGRYYAQFLSYRRAWW